MEAQGTEVGTRIRRRHKEQRKAQGKEEGTRNRGRHKEQREAQGTEGGTRNRRKHWHRQAVLYMKKHSRASMANAIQGAWGNSGNRGGHKEQRRA